MVFSSNFRVIHTVVISKYIERGRKKSQNKRNSIAFHFASKFSGNFGINTLNNENYLPYSAGCRIGCAVQTDPLASLVMDGAPCNLADFLSQEYIFLLLSNYQLVAIESFLNEPSINHIDSRLKAMPQ